MTFFDKFGRRAERSPPRERTVIVGRTRNNEAFADFEAGHGKTVRVLNRNLYNKATAAAGKRISEITGGWRHP